MATLRMEVRLSNATVQIREQFKKVSKNKKKDYEQFGKFFHGKLRSTLRVFR